VRPAEARIALTCIRQSAREACAAKTAATHREPARRGYWYEEVRWQKSVRSIARPDHVGSRKATQVKRRWPRSTPHDVLAHAAAAPR